MENQFESPQPSAEALAHSEKLSALIRDRIRRGDNWMDFAEYMRLALYAPGLGYYSAGARKFGAAGDFVTAPEVSPLFSRCIARVVAEVFDSCSPGVILEVGAGTGCMAAEIIRVLEDRGVVLDRYMILEISADLRERQRQTLEERVPEYVGRVEWLDKYPETPIDGVILANEVLDALPVTRFKTADSPQPADNSNGVQALGVGADRDTFCWTLAPATDILREKVAEIENSIGARLPGNYTSEISLTLPAFVDSLGRALRRGLILIIDYGLPRAEFFHRDRSQGTLICHYRHRAHANPFIYPGLQDITAWVDFTAVAEAAESFGLQIAGYTTQAHFLIGAGVDEEFASASEHTLQNQIQLSRELQTLTMPGQMGERFKVMGLVRGGEAMPTAFQHRDLRHRL
jgi:SAM-dependent MidA family methyltransferase